MKRKKTPPSEFIVQTLDDVAGDTKAEVQGQIRALLSEVRYAGDVKQLAERYGLHYLKSKRMRKRELEEWIINNHPAVRKAGQPDYHIGFDFGASLSRPGRMVIQEQPDGSFKVLSAEVRDGNQRDAGADRRGRQG